jgi:hypothetical protein
MSESAGLKRRGAVALVVVGAHVAAFLSMRYALLHPSPSVETPEFVSIWLTAQAIVRSRNASRPHTKARMLSGLRPTRRPLGAGRAGRTQQPNQSPLPSVQTPHAIDWLAEAERAAQGEVASEADRKRRAEWLSRGTDAESHPLVQAFKPLFPKTPPFGWYHARTHRIEAIKGGPLLIWINDRCFLAFLGLAIIPVCKIGHMEPDGALFEHMHDAADETRFEAPLALP